MRISEEATFAGASWIPYENPTTFEISCPAEGIKIVYYNLKDSGGATSEVVSDSIILDTQKPSVESTVPASGETGVSRQQDIIITFSETMETGSVSLTIYPARNLGAASWSGGNKVLTHNPPGKLIYNTFYIITAEGNDKAGNAIEPYTFSFTTGTPGTIEGYVRTGATPLAGISVEVRDHYKIFHGTLITDVSGHYYKGGLEDRTYFVEPIAPGYNISCETVNLLPSENRQVDFGLSKAWPRFHGSRGNPGFSPDTEIEPTLKLAWSFQFSDANYKWPSGAASPVVAYGNLYIGGYTGTGDYRKIYCLDAQTGAFKWSFLTINGTGAFVTVANDTVYANDFYYYTYALDAYTGAFKWSHYLAGTRTYEGQGPTYANGIVYVRSGAIARSYLSALNAETGSADWRLTIAHSKASALVRENVVYVTEEYKKRIRAFNARTRAVLWSFSNTAGSANWFAAAALHGESIYQCGWDGFIYSINKNNGALRWSIYTGMSMYCTPAVYNGTVYFGRNTIMAVNESDGSLKWSATPSGGMLASPAFANGVLYFTSGGILFGLDEGDGATLWSYNAYADMDSSSPAIADGMLFVATEKGKVLAFENNKEPNEPQSLEQHQFFGGQISSGGNSDLSRLIIKFSMSDPDPYGTLYPDVEIKPTSESFSGDHNFSGEAVSHITGTVTGIVTIEGLNNLTDYHWQARVRDEYGDVSGWVSFESGNKAFQVYDIISPEVISTDPASSEVEVSTAREIIFTFSEPMNNASVVGAFNIYPVTPGTFESFEETGTIATYKPDSVLLGKTVYAVTLEGSASDEAGNPIPETLTFTFETSFPGRISGNIWVSGLGGIPGAVVDVSKDERTIASGTTDHTGFYNITNLPVNSYTVQAVLPGYSLRTEYNVPVLPESTTNLNFTLDQAWPMSFQDKYHSKVSADTLLTPPLKLKWSFYGATYFDGAPAIENGQVFVGSDYGRLYSLDLENGAMSWYYQTGDVIWSTPAITNGIVYIGSEDGKLHAINEATGDFIWSYTLSAIGNISYGSVINNGHLYIGGNTTLFSFDLQNQSVKWSYDAGGFLSSPAIFENNIYFLSANYLQAIGLENRTLRWSRYLGGGTYQESSPAISDGVLYIGNYSGALYAFDALTGNLNWSYVQSGYIANTPLIFDGKVFFGGGETFFALDKSSGSLLWSTGAGQPLDSSPILANETIYIGGTYASGSQKVLAFDPSNGALLWSYQTGSGIWTTPAAADGTLIVGCEDMYVRAFASSAEGDTDSPVITSGPYVSNIQTNEATFSWQTDEFANSMIEYGETESYGSIFSLASFVIDHFVTLETVADNITYHYRVGSKDEYGNGPAWSVDDTFTTQAIPGKEYIYPEIDALVDGVKITNGDIINSAPEIVAVLSDNLTIETTSIKLLIDDVTIESATIMPIDEPRSYRLVYKVPSPLEPVRIRKHTISISVKDGWGNETVWEKSNLKVFSGKADVVGQPLSYPAVFSPASGGNVTISYHLSRDTSIAIYFYDISGKIVMTRKFGSGTTGGRAGYNSFDWNGTMDIGGMVGNGIYTYKITSGGKEIGKGKLVVFD
jgi:outer membrane protein assembly factor BamB